MVLKRITLFVAIPAVVVGVAVVYYFHDPSSQGWAIHCPSKLLFGFDCPACGTQRMLHSLLHGHVADAWHHNPFAFFSLPYFALVAWASASSLPGSRLLRRFTHAPIIVWLYLAAFALWALLRNL